MRRTETTLVSSERFRNEVIYTELDVKRLLSERRKNTTFQTEKERMLIRIPFSIHVEETELTRKICFQTVCSKCDGREEFTFVKRF